MCLHVYTKILFIFSNDCCYIINQLVSRDNPTTVVCEEHIDYRLFSVASKTNVAIFNRKHVCYMLSSVLVL